MTVTNSPLVNEVPDWLRTYLTLEESATEFRIHHPYLVASLFQTPEYAAAIARSVGVTPPGEEYVERTVKLRKLRQARVHSGELTVIAIHSECALHLKMGSNATMATQLATLADLCDLPNVTVHVMPYEIGQYEALRIGSFTLLSNPDRPAPAVNLEGHNGGRLIQDYDETGHYVAAFDHARTLALPPSESRQFITQMHHEWEKKNG